MTITYLITCTQRDNIEVLANDIAYEQTVEVSDACIDHDFIKEAVVGKVLNIERQEKSIYKVVIRYNPDVTGYEISQLINVLFGNISIKNNIKIIDIDFPPSLLKIFPGPGYGINGIRELLGVYERPLACTALKPLGSTAQEFAKIAEDFALGGGDIIKDDHGIANQRYCSFEERIQAVQSAINRANEKTGFNTLYFPNLLGPIESLEKMAEYALAHGVVGVLISPFLVGMDMVRHIASTYNLAIMGHPAFSGTHFHDPSHGITPAVLLGSLFRLIGCDISIYPNVGGRFSFTLQQCHDLNRHLRRPINNIKPAIPAPAGGMSIERIPEMAKLYGKDVIYLIGGALLKDKNDLKQKTKIFLDKIKEHFSECLRPAEKNFSSCEFPSLKAEKLLTFLKFNEDFNWNGRCAHVYKQDSASKFQSITRYELIGKNGEKTKFDVRYFQIEQGGFSSLEKHMHEHVIIGARGKGKLINGSEIIMMSVNDIAYIPPGQIHQLRNESEEPFGFYCIVDHERDRPIEVEHIHDE